MTLYFAGKEHAEDVKAHPEQYITLESVYADYEALRTVKQAATMEALKVAYRVAMKAAKGDSFMEEKLRAEKDARKAALEAA